MTPTFDQAQEAFREQPNELTAWKYIEAAAIYWNDEMIGLRTFTAAIDEVAAWRDLLRRAS